MKKRTIIILSAAVLLLLGSTVGSTRAALTYYSDNYAAQVNVSNIGIVVNENGREVGEEGLLSDLLDADTKLAVGKIYPESLGVTNTGTIDSYVRVILYKYWKNEKGEKVSTLSPDLIHLNLTDDGWIIDESASTAERTVLYYTEPVAAGTEAPSFVDSLQIDPVLTKTVNRTVSEKDGYKTYTDVYTYNGYQFVIEAEADAVQAHNAADAMKSAWGIDVNISEDGTLSLASGQQN